MAYTTDTRLSGTDLSKRLMAPLRASFEAVARYRLYRKTLTELSALSPRELDDLGLHRAMIRSIAYEGAYGK